MKSAIKLYQDQVTSTFNHFARERSPDISAIVDGQVYALQKLADNMRNIKFNTQGQWLEFAQAMLTVYSSLTFIKWKLKPNFQDGGSSISAEIGRPISRMLEKSPIWNEYRTQSTKATRVAYVPNLNPFRSTGNANQQSALDFVNLIQSVEQCQIPPGLESFTVHYVSQETNSSENDQVDAPPFYTQTRHNSFQALVHALGKEEPDTIIIDYFTLPNILLPLIFPKAYFSYMSFGFLAVELPFVRHIYGSAKMTEEFIVHMNSEGHAPTLLQTSRIIGNRQNLQRRLPNDSKPLQDIHQFCLRFSEPVVTLCRWEKISSSYLELCCAIIKARPSVGFIFAGNMVPRLIASLPDDIKSHFLLLEALPPYNLLSKAFAYLETFPEHQGYAVVEAYDFGVPVLCYYPESYNHSLLTERAQSSIFRSVDEVLRELSRLADDDGYRNSRIWSQREIHKSLAVEPQRYLNDLITSMRGANKSDYRR